VTCNRKNISSLNIPIKRKPTGIIRGLNFPMEGHLPDQSAVRQERLSPMYEINKVERKRSKSSKLNRVAVVVVSLYRCSA
jgi:hypothetical protein